jgi:uncharacterized protein YaiE (UPF0345 family)
VPAPPAAESQTAVSSFVGAGTVMPSYSWSHPATELVESRPVRRVMSKEKRKNMIQLSAADEASTPATSSSSSTSRTPLRAVSGELVASESTSEEALAEPKTEEEVALIAGAIKSNFLFQHLSPAQRMTVIAGMRRLSVGEGEWIIRQGDDGDKFYIVDSGRFEVRVKAQAGKASLRDKNEVSSLSFSPEELTALFGSVVHVYESGPNQHPGFGELSLM